MFMSIVTASHFSDVSLKFVDASGEVSGLCDS